MNLETHVFTIICVKIFNCKVLFQSTYSCVDFIRICVARILIYQMSFGISICCLSSSVTFTCVQYNCHTKININSSYPSIVIHVRYLSPWNSYIFNIRTLNPTRVLNIINFTVDREDISYCMIYGGGICFSNDIISTKCSQTSSM